MRHKITAVIIVMLVLAMPFSVAESSGNNADNYDEEDTGESIVVVVKSYEPEVLPSSVIEDDDVNVYAYLMGTTLGSFLGLGETAEPLYSQPKIRNVIVTPLDSDSQKYLLRSPRALRPKTGYSLDNLATVLFTIKRIEKEADIPDRIDLNMQAEVWFENAERFPSLLQQDIVVPEDRDEQKWRENLPRNGHKYSFFSGRGFIRADRITPKYVDFTVYGGNDLIWPYTGTPRPIRSFTLSKGETTTDIRLSEAENLAENRFRVRLTDISDFSIPKAEVEITKRGITEKRIVTEGMQLYPGSSFVVEKIYTPKKAGENRTEYSILIKGKEYGIRSEDYNFASYLVKKYSRKSFGLEGKEGKPSVAVRDKGDICDKVNLLFTDNDLKKGSPEEVACTAIFELKQILREAGDMVDENGVRLKDRASFLIGKIYREKLGDNTRALEYIERSLKGNKGDFIPEARKLASDITMDLQEGAVYKDVDVQEGGDVVNVRLLRIIEPSPEDASYAVISVEHNFKPVDADKIKRELKITPEDIYSEGNAQFSAEWINVATHVVRENGQLYTNDKSGNEVRLTPLMTVGSLANIWNSMKGHGNDKAAREVSYIKGAFKDGLDTAVKTSEGLLYAGKYQNGSLSFYVVAEQPAPTGTAESEKFHTGEFLFSPANRALQEKGYWYNWKIKSISDDKVVLVKVYTGRKPQRANIKYKTLEKGLNYVDGREVVLKETSVKRQAYFTIIPGTGKPLKSVSNFSIHIPVEKRAEFLQTSTDKIGRKINETQKIVDDLSKIINKMDNILKTWKVACLGTFAFLTLKNSLLSGFSRTQARRNIMRGVDGRGGWSAYCKANAAAYGSYDRCIKANSELIEKSIDDAQDVISKLNDDMKDYKTKDWYKELTGKFKGYDEYEDLLSEGLFTERQLRNYRYWQLMKETAAYSAIDGAQTEEGVYGYNLKGEIDGKTKIFEDALKMKADAFSRTVKTIKEKYQNFDKEQPLVKKEIFNTLYQQAMEQKPVKADDFPLLDDVEVLQAIGKEGSRLYAYTLNKGKITGLRKATVNDYIGILTRKINSAQSQEEKDKYTSEKNRIKKKYAGNYDEVITTSMGDVYTDGSTYYVAKASDYSLGRLRTSYAENAEAHVYPDGKPYCIPSGNGNYVKVLEFYQDGSAKTIQEWNVGPDGILCDGDDILVKHNSVLDRPQNDAYRSRLLSIVNDFGRKKSGQMVKVYGRTFRVSDKAAIAQQQTQAPGCYDVMDPSDCDLLFGVCDPVMCPPSRFNLGGAWPVDNVVQTGIIGSIVLGLHNFGPSEPVPICLTGVLAGLQNIRSYLKGYIECLRTAQTEGKSVGICDKIKSIYMCELLVREAAAIFKATGGIQGLMTKLLYGGKSEGGGEYLTFDSSLQNIADSVKFFTQDYAQTAFAAFKGRSTEEIGTEICKQFVHGQLPFTGDIIDQITEPESPPQFAALLTEMPYSETRRESRYQIFYHIYAGESSPVDYHVYLTNERGDKYYATEECRGRSASIPKGGIASHTLDCVTKSGYNQICVVINGRTYCGFGKVTTEFSINYMNDLVVQDELSRKITSEEECVPDYPTTSPSMGSIPLPGRMNLLETGIVRVCSVKNPGLGTNPQDWKYIGTCGKDKEGHNLGACWIDMRTVSINDMEKFESVDRAISEAGLNATKQAMGINAISKEKSKELFQQLEDYPRISPQDKLSLVSQYRDLASRSLSPEITVKSRLEIVKLLLSYWDDKMEGIADRVPCSTDDDCVLPEVCFNGYCSSAPLVPVCRDGTTWDPDKKECVRRECTSDADCVLPETCVNGECYAPELAEVCGKDELWDAKEKKCIKRKPYHTADQESAICQSCDAGLFNVDCSKKKCHSIGSAEMVQCYYAGSGIITRGDCESCSSATSCRDLNYDREQCEDSLCTSRFASAGCRWDARKRECVEKAKSKPVVIIDPGHGGRFNNAVYDATNPERKNIDVKECTNTAVLCEKDFTLEIAKFLKNIAESNGYETLMTRTEDTDYGGKNANDDLAKRIDWIKEQIKEGQKKGKNYVLVSIHLDSPGAKPKILYPYPSLTDPRTGDKVSAYSEAVCGCSDKWYDLTTPSCDESTKCGSSKALAEEIASTMRNIKELEDSSALVGAAPITKEKTLGILRIPGIPTVLVETTSIDDPNILEKSYLQNIAESIFEGINYYAEHSSAGQEKNYPWGSIK